MVVRFSLIGALHRMRVRSVNVRLGPIPYVAVIAREIVVLGFEILGEQQEVDRPRFQ